MHRASQTDQIREGAELFAVNCSPCHGPRMQGSESAFDLRKYPPEQRDRFLNSVTRGKEKRQRGSLKTWRNPARSPWLPPAKPKRHQALSCPRLGPSWYTGTRLVFEA